MKKLKILILLLLLAVTSFAKQIDEPTAKTVATNFIKSLTTNSNGRVAAQNFDLTLAYPTLSSNTNSRLSYTIANTPYFIYNFGESGFIIVSNEDAALPILGYSNESNFSEDKVFPQLAKWLETYKKQIRHIQANNIEPTEEIILQWKNLLSDNGRANAKTSESNAVNPLVQTKWDQSPYFNDMCPYDSEYNTRAVTGCPATAMAQIMKYWEYPAKGSSYHSYNHETYGTLSANFGSTYYDWESMPNTVSSTNEAVATLLYHCGVAVEMGYGAYSSGSYVIIDRSPTPEQSCEYALKTYFGYDAESIEGLQRRNYSDTQWKSKLKSELDAGRPIQYAGFGQGGHTWVCDGYDNNDFFHMNWGWGGYLNGYFLLDALTPGTGGTGSGAGSYNEGQQALIGIKPPDASQTYQLEIYDDVKTNKSTIAYGEGFSISTDILNDGNNTFSGDYSAVIFDDNDAFVDFVEIIPNVNLQSGYHYTNGITFSTDGLLTMLPGEYRIYIFYRPTGGNWVGIKSDSWDFLTSDYVDIEVVHENVISLYSTIDVLTDDLYNEGSLSVKLDVANYYSEDFSGIMDVSLYSLDGEFVATIEEKTGVTLCSNCHFSDGLTFTTSNLNVPPGTYLLALLHQWDGYDYELTGSTSTFINPVKIVLQVPPLNPDLYENNDDYTDAYSLTANFSSGMASVSTSNSNIHIGTDWDFYSIDLEQDYDYAIDIRLHDSYNSGNGSTYSVDGLFLYSFDGENWSEAYDDVLPGSITSEGNEKLTIVVSPYFIGERGTYQLDINLERSMVLGTGQKQDGFTIYPNPASDKFRVRLGTLTNQIDRIEIINLQGQVVMFQENISHDTDLSISNLSSGSYFVRANYNGIIETKKLLVK